jgi:hypothetical protein
MITPNPFERPPRGLEERHVPPPLEEAGRDAAAETAPQRHEDVIARVRELLGKYPTLGSRQLFDLAIRMHPDLEQAGFRSFHARYVLPLKREKARAEGRLPKPRTPRTVPKRARRSRTGQAEAPETAATAPIPDTSQLRTRVRDVLLRLARQVAVAESRADLVDALARVEEMVDEVLRATQPQATATAPPEDESASA